MWLNQVPNMLIYDTKKKANSFDMVFPSIEKANFLFIKSRNDN